MRRQRLSRDDEGSALVEVTWLGILLLVPLMFIVISVFEVQRGAFAVTAGARAAARAYALAPTDAEGQQRAEAAARQALDDQGLQGQGVRVKVSCEPFPHNCHSGTSVITVKVATDVTLAELPSFLHLGEPTFHLDASHTVPIGQYQEITGEAAP